jgi:hypothetical protein
MGLIQFVKDVGPGLEVGDIPQVRSAQASGGPLGADAPKTAALVGWTRRWAFRRMT